MSQGASSHPHEVRAYFAGVVGVLIWSCWYIVARWGVQRNLTPADITMLRFATAAVVTLPWVFGLDWRGLPWKKLLIIALGCGFPYTLLSMSGLRYAPVANAGVLVNGLLPVVSALVSWVWLKKSIHRSRWLGMAIVFVANILMLVSGLHGDYVHWSWTLLLASTVVFAVYMAAIAAWPLPMKTVIVTVPWINAVLFFPLWLLLPSNLSHASWQEISLQMIYQGIFVSLGALWANTYSVHRLGAVTASVIVSFVPTVTALLGVILLHEHLNTLEIVAIVLCTIGLVQYGWAGAAKRRNDNAVRSKN